MEKIHFAFILLQNHTFFWLASGNMEGKCLAYFEGRVTLVDPNNVLQSWDPTLVNPCTWFVSLEYIYQITNSLVRFLTMEHSHSSHPSVLIILCGPVLDLPPFSPSPVSNPI
ncbi:hypothetical protein N665_1195s0008 [Sinapis alba]|nr:hypothetical protein N665_1195s0008 [Sinapis alba]